MALTQPQIRQLVAFVAGTRDVEIPCDECLAGMAEFAETELAGLAIPDAVRRIEEHIAFCPECREEYELLKAATAACTNDAGDLRSR